MTVGIVGYYNRRKGYGFIRPDDGEPEVIVEEKEIHAFERIFGRGRFRLGRGVRVEFEFMPVLRGRRAGKLKLCPEGETPPPSQAQAFSECDACDDRASAAA
ncbi:CspA family cold shock protein [Luteibacter rhizovicinus]|uniref:CspA family cold shock protein n=1 Tax=Luteibacter rhizovicinus TaxID=242606 RepID=A0A4R3YWQ7_9GAMM|nr:CspA family cold shock protein [Luteibacter rhizovicinus]